MSNKLTFEKCNIKDWELLINNSKQSNLFSRVFYLKNAETNFHLWKVLQGKEIKAGVCLNVDSKGKNCIEDKFIIHNGIFFNLNDKRALSKRREDEFQITDFIIKNLITIYDEIFISLDPQVNDVRPFQWFNYDNDGPKFQIKIKYTTLLNLEELKLNKKKDEELSIFKNLEPVRRYSIRQAIKDKCKVEFNSDPLKFLELYKIFLKKGNPINFQNEFRVISDICSALLNENRGIVTYVYNNSNDLVYSMITGWDNCKAYYLFGVGSDKKKEPWQGTIGLWEILKYISRIKKLNIFDFEGVNSPKRGWFKLGFGGELISYYQIKYDKKKIYTN